MASSSQLEDGCLLPGGSHRFQLHVEILVTINEMSKLKRPLPEQHFGEEFMSATVELVPYLPASCATRPPVIVRGRSVASSTRMDQDHRDLSLAKTTDDFDIILIHP